MCDDAGLPLARIYRYLYADAWSWFVLVAPGVTRFNQGRERRPPVEKHARHARCASAALGCDPIEAMAQLAMDENEPSALRLAALKELAQYVAPKRKAVEISWSTNRSS